MRPVTFPAPDHPYVLQPADYGLLAWNYPVSNMTGSAAPSAATIYLQKIMVPQSLHVAKIAVEVPQAGTSYTNAQVGLISSAGLLLGASTVRASAGTNTFGVAAYAAVDLTAAVDVVGGPTTFVWAAIHLGTNAATTVQFAIHAVGVAAGANQGINSNLALSAAMHGTYTGHATNDLATIVGAGLTLGSIAGGSSNLFWCALL